MLSKLFGRSNNPSAEKLSGPFYKTIRADGRDYARPELEFEPGSILTVRPRWRDLGSYIVASRSPGESIAAGAWSRGMRLVVLRGTPIRNFPNDVRLALFERVLVESELPAQAAFGDNGAAVERFLGELHRRGQVDAADRIRSNMWLDCQHFLEQQQRDPNAQALSHAAWEAAFALARNAGAVEACNAASDIAKEAAMKAAHLSDVADARDAAEPGSEAWLAAEESIRLRVQGFEWTPIHRSEALNIAAGLVAERAALAIVVQPQLTTELFAALTEPMRRYVDPDLFAGG